MDIENSLSIDKYDDRSIAIPAGKRHVRPKMNSPSALLFLTTLSAAVVFSYNVVLQNFNGGFDRNLFVDPSLRRLKAEYDEKLSHDKRLLEVTKEAWPECVEMHLTAGECKDFIDEYIYDNFTGRDKYTRTLVKGKRGKDDHNYNVVVILMNDGDMVEGTGHDGQVHYDWEWESSGELATPEQQAQIPNVIATETEAGAIQAATTTTETSGGGESTVGGDPAGGETPAAGDPTTAAPPAGEPTAADPVDIPPQADPESELYEPLILEDSPLTIEGATVEGAILETDDNPVAGGVVIDPELASTPEGEAKLADAIEASPLVNTASGEDPLLDGGEPTGDGAPVDGTTTGDGATDADAGGTAPDTTGGSGSIELVPRMLPDFDCSGMTGNDCCLMIKLMVPDQDKYGNAIQCFLNYVEGSDKAAYMWRNARGQKVFILENHNLRVSQEPTLVGYWPEGQDDLHDWLDGAGAPSWWVKLHGDKDPTSVR